MAVGDRYAWRQWRERPPKLIAAGIGLIAAVALTLAAQAGTAHADARMTVRLEPAAAQVPAGDNLTFSAYVECSISPRCNAVTLTLTAPTGVSGRGAVSHPLPPDVTGVVARADGSVVVTYSSITAGRSSQLTVSWPTVNYYTTPGPRTAAISAVAANGDGQPSTDTAAVTVLAAPNPTLTKVGPAAAAFGDIVTYTIQATNDPAAPNRPRGTLALEDAKVTDTLPPGTELVSASPAGYTHNPMTRTVSWPVDTDTTRPGSQFAQIKTFPYALRYQVRLRVTAPAGTTLVNHAVVDCNPYGPDETPVRVTAQASTAVGGGSVGGRFSKYSDVPQAIDGQHVSFTLAATNTGTAAGSVSAVDHVPSGFDPSTVNIYEPGSTGAWSGDATVQVTYASGPAHTFTYAQRPTYIVRTGAEITGITVTVPGVGAGVQVRVQILGVVDAGELTGNAAVVNNCADFRIEGSGPVLSGRDCAEIRIVPGLAIAEITKFTDQQPVGPGGTLGWTIVVHNDPADVHSSPLRPHIVDLLPEPLMYVPGSFALAPGQPSACPGAGDFTVTTVPHPARGRTALQAVAKAGATIPASDTACAYTFSTTVRQGAVSGSYNGDPTAANYKGNIAALYDVEKPLWSEVTDTGDFDSDNDTTEHVAVATEDFSIAENSALFISKEVRGDRDHAFLSATAGAPVGTSSVGGTVAYRLRIGNLTDKQLTNVVAYDLLPAPDTHGLTSGRYNDPAVSTWRPTLTGAIADGGLPLHITYSTKADPCRPELDNTRGHTAPFYCSGHIDATFVPADQVTNWGAVRAVRFDFGSHIFMPNMVHVINYSMRVPVLESDGTGFDGGERTWNKAAAQGDRRDENGTVPLLATEPTWVIDQLFVPGQPVQPPPPPGGPGAPAMPGLPVTSGALQLGVVLAGLVTLLAGVGLVIAGRRRRTS